MSETTTIGDLASSGVLSLGDGYRTKKSELRDDGYRIIRVADVKDGRIALNSPDFVSTEHERQIGNKIATAGDVLLTTKGTVGRVAVVPSHISRAVYSPQLCWFRIQDESKVDNRYLGYWLQSHEFTAQASYLQGNTDMAPYISLSDLRRSKITLPPLPEQQAIAEVLGALDDKIAANTHLAATAESFGLTQLRSQVSATTLLTDLATLSKKTVNPVTLGIEPVDHYSLPAFDTDQLPVTETADQIKSNKFLVDGDVVLLSKLNPRFPRVWRANPSSDRASLASTEFLVLEPQGTSRELLWSALAQPTFASDLDAKVAGTSGSHQRVKPTDALATPLLDPRGLPSSAAKAIESSLLLASEARSQNRTLAATRDALLPKLMSGELRVRDAETLVKNVGV